MVQCLLWIAYFTIKGEAALIGICQRFIPSGLRPTRGSAIQQDTGGVYNKDMKKKLADEIGKAFVRLHCSHWYWHMESPFVMGSLSRGVVVCNNCGKRKFIEELKDSEVLIDNPIGTESENKE